MNLPVALALAGIPAFASIVNTLISGKNQGTPRVTRTYKFGNKGKKRKTKSYKYNSKTSRYDSSWPLQVSDRSGTRPQRLL